MVRAARERLSPSLISAVTTALVFAPLVVAGGIAGLEIVHPMAVVILGGLVSSTLVTLIVVPRFSCGSALTPSPTSRLCSPSRWST